MSNNTSTAIINKGNSSGDTNDGVSKHLPAKPQLTPADRICIIALSITCLTTSLSQLPLSPYPGLSRILLAISIVTTVAGCIACALATMRERPTASSSSTFPCTIAFAALLVFHFTFALAMLPDNFGYREVALVFLVGAGMELGAVGVLMIQGWSVWGPGSNADVEVALCGEKKGLE
jgi:hypothetical protein